MTYAPQTLRDLMTLWRSKGGADLGIVGDVTHAGRASYHNGLDRAIVRLNTVDRDKIAAADYTFRLLRDRQGASDAASAVDLGKLNGSLVELQRFSRWLVARAQGGASPDIREIIYSPDGRVVKRWDANAGVIRDGYPAAIGQGDASHLWHTHISFYRDSERRDQRPVFLPYFAEDDMQGFNVPEVPMRATLKENPDRPGNSAWMYTTSALVPDGQEVSLKPIRPLPLVGYVSAAVHILAYEPSVGDTNTVSRAMYVRATDIAKTEKVPEPEPIPVDCTQAIEDAIATDRLGARIDAKIVWPS